MSYINMKTYSHKTTHGKNIIYTKDLRVNLGIVLKNGIERQVYDRPNIYVECFSVNAGVPFANYKWTMKLLFLFI